MLPRLGRSQRHSLPGDTSSFGWLHTAPSLHDAKTDRTDHLDDLFQSNVHNCGNGDGVSCDDEGDNGDEEKEEEASDDTKKR